MSFSTTLRRAAVAPAFTARAFSTTSARPLAKITIIGNLADTPEVHPTSTGREVVRYAVASNSGSRENRKTSWFKVTSFAEGPSRDYLMNLPKGATVYVEGDASLHPYTDANGQNRTSFSVVQRMPPSQYHVVVNPNIVQAKSRFFDVPKLLSRASKQNPQSILVHTDATFSWRHDTLLAGSPLTKMVSFVGC